jgi:hypothetical protein
MINTVAQERIQVNKMIVAATMNALVWSFVFWGGGSWFIFCSWKKRRFAIKYMLANIPWFH